MPRRARVLPLLLASAVAAGCLAGCANDWSAVHPAPTPIGTPAPGFLPASAPAPEATVTPRAGSWDGVRPSPGYRVVLLTAGDEPETQTLVAAVRDWAGENRVDLRTVVADDDHVAGILEAIDLAPDLIVSAGRDLVDALTVVTASHLDREFLVLGAELAEPTHNVTAVDWEGATFRGEGVPAASPYDPESFTPERSADAIRAGVAAVLHDLTGVVLRIP